MNKLVSVIVPVYNVEKYLSRCIDSIINQTYKNLEIILVDDGSPDRCGDICDQYAIKDSRIKVIHKKNGGLSDARNAGINLAKGDYITFIDSDDWIHPKYIETLYDLVKKHNADISVCNFIRTTSEDHNDEISLIDVIAFNKYEALEQFTDKYYVQMVIACGKLYKKDLFHNVRFPVGRIHEDEFTTYKLIYNANKIVFTTTPLYYYWQREDSIMGSGFNINHRLDALDAFIERAEFFKKIGLENESSKTYKSSFLVLMTIIRKFNELDDFSKKEVLKRFNIIKKCLRSTKQNVVFKIFYEFYFINPKLLDFIFRIFVKVKMRLISFTS